MGHTLGTAAILLQPAVVMCAQIGQVLPRELECRVDLLFVNLLQVRTCTVSHMLWKLSA